MKILLIGAGAVGSVVSQLMQKDAEISEITCASNDITRAKEFITENDKVKLVELDAANIDEIVQKANGMDLIINVSLPCYNENILEAALRVGANYQDMDSELADLKTVEQLRFDDRFKTAGLSALINSGVAPGITNLLAREAADQLDEVDSVRIRCFEEQKASEFIFTWSAERTLDDVTAPPLVFRDGKFINTKPFADAEEYEFAAPVGKRRAYSLYGDEVATVPFYIKANSVDFKSAGSDIEFAKMLSEKGLFSKDPIEINGAKVVPLEFFAKKAPPVPSPQKMKQMVEEGVIKDALFALAVEVSGKKQGKAIQIKLSATFPDIHAITQKFPGANYISYPTGLSAYAFAKVISKIKTSGVFPPETLQTDLRKEVMQELERNGIKISQQIQEC